MRARHEPEDTDWAQIDLLYATLERLQPSPVVTLNRGRGRLQGRRGRRRRSRMIEPLAAALSGYFHFFGVKGALLMQLGRDEEARVAFDRAIALANTRGGGGAYPHASGSIGEGQRAARAGGEVDLA